MIEGRAPLSVAQNILRERIKCRAINVSRGSRRHTCNRVELLALRVRVDLFRAVPDDPELLCRKGRRFPARPRRRHGSGQPVPRRTLHASAAGTRSRYLAPRGGDLRHATVCRTRRNEEWANTSLIDNKFAATHSSRLAFLARARRFL